MVRLSNIATDPETDSVLVSGHYDSAPFSPGAGVNFHYLTLGQCR